MADGDVWVFLSYAHDDDLKMSSSEGEVGFVTFLDKMLEVKLRDLGATTAKVWIDRKRISDGDLFDGAIDEGLRKAELLIVVMSNNWMQRPYCRKELEAFAELRRKSGVANVQERMIVVGKGHVDRLKRPFELQGQEGFLFYARDETNGVVDVTPFYNRGKANDQFYDRRDQLAVFLQKRVDLISAGGALGTSLSPQQPIVVPTGRTIYLSKPASDLTAAYARLAFELQGKGFTVVPDVSRDLPNDATATAIIKDALGKAEASVHLVGEKPGFAPEGLDPIVKLQLALARENAAPDSGAGERVFRRIIWAPKVLDSGGVAVGPVVERDPMQALERCDKQIGTDKIDGDILSKFVEFLFQYLAETAPRPPREIKDRAEDGGGICIYLDYNTRDDEDSALALAASLKDGPVRVEIPVSGEPAPEARAYNSDLLAKCDGVLLFWGASSELWVRSEADRLSDWQGLGRTQQFLYQSLVAGPPPASKKKAMKLLFPKGQFDRFVDLAEAGQQTGDLLVDLAPKPKPVPP